MQSDRRKFSSERIITTRERELCTGCNIEISCPARRITDEPPEEVTAAGHDRCIIPIKPEHVDAWLDPDRSNLKALYSILDDRARPYYEHRMAA
jgi:hypothetical protein